MLTLFPLAEGDRGGDGGARRDNPIETGTERVERSSKPPLFVGTVQ